MTELAARVQLSRSPTFEALVFASLHQGDRGTVAAFEQAVAAIPQVLPAQRLFGDPDYLLRTVSTNWPPTSSSTTISSPRCPACGASPRRSS